MSLILAEIGPNLVNLDSTAGQIAHLLVHEVRTAIADLDQQAADRVAVRVGHSLRAPDRISLDKAVDNLDAAGERNAVHGVYFQSLYAV